MTIIIIIIIQRLSVYHTYKGNYYWVSYCCSSDAFLCLSLYILLFTPKAGSAIPIQELKGAEKDRDEETEE